MECSFKTPAKYPMKITTREYIVIDVERKVIAKCNYEDDALFIQQTINSHEKLVEALERIQRWQQAYPLIVFPKPDLKKARKVLKDAGMTLDAISADNMRHVLDSIKDIVEQALESEKS